jgi:exopolysaccharide production protein ExoQ
MTVSYDAPSAVRRPEISQYVKRRAEGPTALDWVFGTFALICYEGAFFPILRTLRQGSGGAGFDDAGETGDPIARYALLGVIIILVGIMAGQWRKVYPTLRRTWPFWLFVLFCFASATWSENSTLAGRRAISLFGSFLFGVYAFTTFGPRRFILMLAVVGGAAAFFSLVLLAVAPSLAYDQSYYLTNAVRGVYSQKNQLSAYNLMGLCAAISVLFFHDGLTPARRIVVSGSALMMLTTMMLSRGASSMIALGFVAMLWLAYYDGIAWRARLVAGYFCLILVSVLAFMIWFYPDELLGLFGKDASITGRWPVWIESVNAVLRQPLLGYGYNSFWDPQLARTRYIWQLVGWPTPGAHNGWLDLMLGVGVVAAAVYTMLWARVAILALRFARLNAPGFKWFVLWSVAVFILNVDEGTLAWPDAISSQLIFGYCLVEAYLAQRRLV